jgi:hypothetical protein
MDGDAQSEDLGNNGPGNPGLVAPEDLEGCGSIARDFAPGGTAAYHRGTDGALWNATHARYLHSQRCHRSLTGNQHQ